MNIFFLDENPYLAAQYLCDKHLSKMQLESAQLISTAVHLIAPGLAQSEFPLYKPTHKNHPSAVWMRENDKNFWWFLCHCYGMNQEWLKRGHKPHRSFTRITQVYGRKLWFLLPEADSLSPIPFCGPDEVRATCPKHNNLTVTVQLYRKYYSQHKRAIARWPINHIPPFVK
jgi:hypothetical protein